MGRLFIEHPGGSKVYECKKCRTPFTNKESLRSTRFTGATGRAYLFDTAVNIKFSSSQERMMLTGKHTVRDVICIVCNEKVGWFYEFAADDGQRYKEGKVILEKALIRDAEGFSSDTEPSFQRFDETTASPPRRRSSHRSRGNSQQSDLMTDESYDDDDDEDPDIRQPFLNRITRSSTTDAVNRLNTTYNSNTVSLLSNILQSGQLDPSMSYIIQTTGTGRGSQELTTLRSVRNLSQSTSSRSSGQALPISRGSSTRSISQDSENVSYRDVISAPYVVVPSITRHRDEEDDDEMDFKMVFVVNKSLDMKAGMMSLFVGKTATGLFRKINAQPQSAVVGPDELSMWGDLGEKMIILQADTCQHMKDLELMARNLRLPCHMSDQLEGQARKAVLGIFGEEREVNKVTGRLKVVNN